MASSFVVLSKNMIPVRVVNVCDKARLVKVGEVLSTYAPITCINRNLQTKITESSDTLVKEILQSAELTAKQRSAVERLLTGGDLMHFA